MRVSATGAFLDAQPLLVGAPPGGIRPFDVRVASNRSEYLVVWQDNRLGSPDVFGARIFLDGGAPDSPLGFEVVSGPGEQSRPDVVWEGERWIVAWTHSPDSGMPNVEGRLVTTSPVGTDPVFSISSRATLEAVPRLASNRAGRSLVVYQAFDPSLLNSRVRGRFITRLGRAARCSTADECASGFCVDGVCCDVACNGSSQLDCQACSIAAGAAQNGLCGPINVGAICRPAATQCDVAETCSGAFDCPPDVAPVCDGGVDAGPPDAGTVDGGSAGDAGVGVDGGQADGGRTEPRRFAVGCGCGPSSLGMNGVVLAMLAAVMLERKGAGMRQALSPTLSPSGRGRKFSDRE